jgi:hypothetical protein
MKKIFLILAAVAISSVLLSQESRVISLSGYVSSLQTVMFDSLKGSFNTENLLHNRLNLKLFAGNNITFAAELRNRLFTGDMVSSGPGYSELIGADPGWTDLSWNIVSENSLLLNTTVDRWWADFNYGKFQARIGRQRINWGQALVWNPNDVFNAYSFFDFDYVERPGSDAVRLQYYPSDASALELAVKADREEDITAAGLFRFNKAGYDIQLLAGYINSSDYMAGLGWSGAVGGTSLRGEFSWFRPAENFSDTTGTLLFTVGLDRIFKDNSMLQAQLMYCNNPVDLSDFNSFYTGNLSSKNLAFSRFTAFGQFSWAVTPLLNLGISAMWFPDLKGYFTGPSLDFSMAENLDFSFIWQHFRADFIDERLRINLVFLRFKYSF